MGMPMRKDGGRIARKHGGKVERKHKANGGETDDEEKMAKDYGPNDTKKDPDRDARKHGGRTERKHRADGGTTDEPVSDYLRNRADRASFLGDHGKWGTFVKSVHDKVVAQSMAAKMMESGIPGGPDLDDKDRNNAPRKNGGRTEHHEKHREKRAHGGRISDMEGGGGGALGRLEKLEDYGDKDVKGAKKFDKAPK